MCFLQQYGIMGDYHTLQLTHLNTFTFYAKLWHFCVYAESLVSSILRMQSNMRGQRNGAQAGHKRSVQNSDESL